MPKFKDSKDREWSVDITIGTTMRLKADGVNFHELAENKYSKFLALEKDDEALARLLFALIKPQAEPLGVTEDDFVLDSMFGEYLQSGWEAFGVAYLGFIRDPAIRSSLTKVLERSRRLQGKAAAVMEEKFARLEKIGEEKIAAMAASMSDEKMGQLLDEQLKSPPLPTSSEPSSALPVS